MLINCLDVQSGLKWENRGQFFAQTIHCMRWVQVDPARRRNARRRPPLVFVGSPAFNAYDLPGELESGPARIVAFEEAMPWIERRDPLLGQSVGLHYSAGLTIAELARFFETSETTAKRRLLEAPLLLHRRIKEIIEAD